MPAGGRNGPRPRVNENAGKALSITRTGTKRRRPDGRARTRLIVRLCYPLFIFCAVLSISVLRALIPPRPPAGPTPGDLGLAYESVTFAAPGGPRLKGWLITAPDAAGTIVCLHGYPADKSDILPFVTFLHPRYNLLLFDFRAMGESGGRFTGLGRRETQDALAAVRFLETRAETAGRPVALWGYSLGGAVAIMAAAGNGKISALVTDSAFASLEEMIVIYYRAMGFLGKPFAGAVRLLARLMQFDRVRPEDAVSRVSAPLLISHSLRDPLVPVEHALRLRRNAAGYVRLHLAATEGHFAASDPAYQALVLDFLRRHMP